MKRKMILGVGAAIMSLMILTTVSAFAEENDNLVQKASRTVTLYGTGAADTAEVKGVMGFSIVHAAEDKGVVAFSIAGDYEALVEEGILSQEKADQMKAYLEEQAQAQMEEIKKMETMDEGDRAEFLQTKAIAIADPYEEMVNAGILSVDDADKIREFLKQQAQERLEASVQERTERYQSEGILSKEKADAVAEYLRNFSVSGIHKNEIIEGGEARPLIESKDIQLITESEEAQASEVSEARPVIVTIARGFDFELDSLVKEGIITEDQAKAMAESDENHWKQERELLVEDGILAEMKAARVQKANEYQIHQ